MIKKIARILKYLADYKGKIALYFLFSLLATLFSTLMVAMLGPVLQVLFSDGATAPAKPSAPATGFINQSTAYINEQLLQYDKLDVLMGICLTLIVVTVLKNLFLFSATYILNPLRNAVLRRIRDNMFTKMLSLPIGFFTEERKGDLISRMTNDVNEVELSIMATLEVFIREPLAIIFTLGFMLAISVKLTLAMLIFLPVAGLVIGRIGRSLRKSSNVVQQNMGLMLGVIDETLIGMRIVKAFNAEKNQHLRYMELNNTDFRLRNKIATRRELASPTSETMGVIVVSCILWYGGSLIFKGGWSLAPQSFLVYIAMFTQIINPFKSLSTSFLNIQKGTAALDRIEEILNVNNTITELPDAHHIKDFNHTIEFRNVSFAYGDKQILKNINLTIEKGKTIALVGSSGAGKSTLVDLIPRFHDVTGGEILIDGKDIKHYKIDELRRLMGVVSQDPILFNDTIFNNIKLGTGGATKERVIEAATIAHSERFIANKPDGYETVVGDRGSRLSGGERQRITIARAVLKNPPILILDEATSSLDTESERIVQEAINKLMQNRTCVVIAHRLSTVQHADEIIVMDAGSIVERGNHHSLLAAGGIYTKLVEMQQVK
jgi:subfamily B ATP-binding cassette protein MsbA